MSTSPTTLGPITHKSQGQSPPSSGSAGERRRRHAKARRRGLAIAAIAGVAAGLAVLAGSAGPRPATVTVFPIPGSQVASPQTQIVFRGVPVRELGAVQVSGSRSGVHRGRLLSDTDNRGGSFLPSRPFFPGERVTVRMRSHLLEHGRSFTFTVATPAGPLPDVPLPVAARAPGDVLSFHSRSDLAPAAVQITARSAQASDGDIFIAPEHGPVQSGPMIVDPVGTLVWFHPVPVGDVAADFRVQRYGNSPVLTWWQGYMGAGVGVGEDVIYDSTYRQLATVHAANGLSADLHEFLLLGGGRALITAYYPVYWDASSVRGPKDAIVLDSVVQEIDVKTGLPLFQWDSLDHVPLSDSYQPLPTSVGQPYDYFHINSIQLDRGGDLIVSGRNTWAAYKIDARTGQILWTLGGKHSSFKLSHQATFAFQHNVRVRADDRIVTLFDDGAGPPTVHEQSRALTLRLDPSQRTATLVQENDHAPTLSADYEGDVQELSDGDQFVGWGQQPYFTEYDAAGKAVFDGRFVGGNTSYRAYRYPWQATPGTPPAVAAATAGPTTTVYASWNGATTVAKWQFMAGSTPNALEVFATEPKQGFETQAAIPAAPFVAVSALDAAGRVLATSAIIQAG